MKSILYLSLIDWDYIMQRPQHIANELSKNYEVDYIYEKSTLKWLLEQKNKTKAENNKHDRLHLKRIWVQPFGRFKKIDHLNIRIVKKIITDLLAQKEYEMIWVTHPKYVDTIPSSYKGKIVYDCMDYHAGFHDDPEKRTEIEFQEQRLAQVADYIFTSSQLLYQRIVSYATFEKVHFVPNAADSSHFMQARSPKSGARTIVGYFGTISYWFDFELLEKLSTEFSDLEFQMIGPIEVAGIVKRFSSFPNVKFLGKVNFEVLPIYLKEFDVCIMPFKKNDLIESVDPVKIYEYLAGGKPVVSVYYEGLERFSDYIYTATSFTEFSEQLIKALKEDNLQEAEKRISFVSENTWTERALFMQKKINEIHL
ncbi:glycosyltransferase [Saccharibacillus endophyticus]|uniref:Glycosyl transferase n=1 Tax=Saccharibacillus endophyticus TaxID=2060666 RepID=A0ABQ2A7Z2_9BACL|nr:glycosyltransferase [Saccharibacillus endophyticus]GGH87164.1 glycosyl transferase [Saccharibacillus endophyticus]